MNRGHIGVLANGPGGIGQLSLTLFRARPG